MKIYQQEKLVPELRFPEFNDYSNWYKKDLSRIGKIITGNTPSTKNKEYWGGNNQWITPTDINESRFVINSERKLSNKGFEKSRHVPKDSVLVTCIASIGKNCITNKTTSFNQQINGIIPNKDYSSRFIYYLMEYYSPKLSKFAGITATPILNKKDFSKMTFMFPSFNEQKRIGNFLSLIDEKIELLEKKKEIKLKIKEYYIQQIFLEDWDNKIKFYDYKPLNEITFYQEGPGVRNYQYTNKGVKLLNVANLKDGNLYLDNTDRYISEEEAYGKYKHFLVDEGDLIIASSGIKVEYFDKKIGFAKKEHLPLCMNTSTIRFKT
ncbi:MAG: restriction endonuclease subunit S, partial [Methanobrevibacter wolinii]